MHVRKVFKSGNSLVIAIPKQLADHLRIYSGSQLVVTLGEGSIIHISMLEEFLRKSKVEEVKYNAES